MASRVGLDGGGEVGMVVVVVVVIEVIEGKGRIDKVMHGRTRKSNRRMWNCRI